jgi:hypothetical protein
MKSKIFTFRDRFDILMEISLSGVAKRLIGEISDKTLDKKASWRKCFRGITYGLRAKGCYTDTRRGKES